MVDAMAYSVRLAHLDGHLNMHLHPMVLRILRELAPRYDIRAMRLSREDVGAALRYDRATSRASSGRASSSAPSPPTRRRVSARPASRPPTASTACTRPGTSTSATCLRWWPRCRPAWARCTGVLPSGGGRGARDGAVRARVRPPGRAGGAHPRAGAGGGAGGGVVLVSAPR